MLPYFQVDIIAFIIPGLLHKTDGTLSREHRRQLFMLKAKTEEDERKTRALLFEQHYNKCAYLRYLFYSHFDLIDSTLALTCSSYLLTYSTYLLTN